MAATWTPKFEGKTNAGTPLVFGKLETYEAGTSTPLATYTTQDASVANTNPVILDASGRANVWLIPSKSYKLILKSLTGVIIWTVDNFAVSDPSFAPQFASDLASGQLAKTIFWQPPESGGGLISVADQFRQTPIRPERFMNAAQRDDAYNRMGTIDLTFAVQTAIDTGRPVELNGLYSVGALTGTNIRIYGNGTLRSRAESSGKALLTMTGGSVQGISIESPTASPALYGIIAHGQGPSVRNVTFSGDYGHCVYASDCTGVEISNNTVKSGGSHTAVFVIENCTGFQASGNVIEEHSGFGIQARFSGLGSIINNRIGQRYFSQNFTAASATQTFTVTTGRSCSRFSAFSNGFFRPVTVATTGTNTYSVTVSGLTASQPLTIYSFVGLECLQANSGCYDVAIVGNVVGSSGDSGVVIGADYHNTAAAGATPVWVLDANQVVPTDYPSQIVVSNNVIRGPTLASGVAVNNGTDCIVIGNQISNIGYTNLEAYKAGVSLALVYGGICKDNIVDGSNGHTLGAVKFVGGQDVRRPPSIGRNRAINCKSLETFPMRSPLERSFGYVIDSPRVDDTVTRAIDDMLASTWASGNYTSNIISLAQVGGTGVAKDASVAYGYYTALRTLANNYVDLGINTGVQQLFRNKLVRVSFFGKADNAGDSGYVQLYYQFPNDDPNPPEMTTIVNTAAFTEYSMVMALGDVSNLFVRIGGNTGTTRISRLRIDMLDIESQ